MRRPPACVAFVARTHGLVGLVIVGSVLLLRWITRDLPGIEFGPHTNWYAGGLAVLYLLTAVLVWFGAPFGLLFSRVCSLIYLPRPNFGSRIWDIMGTPEFRAHFERTPRPSPPDAPVTSPTPRQRSAAPRWWHRFR
ncbi:MAG: hypothetical protein FJ399_05440 [Verrucomicrobia bacterium]|nr:hypothetical protein [Verrucomicrobiota bacterium]